MSNITKVKHVGAIGGNVLKNFNIICDYKNKNFYIVLLTILYFIIKSLIIKY